MSYGILSFGAYIPRYRLPRPTIANAVSWAIPGAKNLAKGERAVANWDEDSITMAVAAARECLASVDTPVDHIQLASTTLPFLDRSNAGIVADALNLAPSVASEDLAGSRRAATSALLRASRAPTPAHSSILIASECRDTKPGSAQEMLYGDAAAALLLGSGEPIALIRGAASVHSDLVDLYRTAEGEFDYALEDRWIREEGWLKLVPAAIEQAMRDAGVALGEVHRLVVPATESINKALARRLGVDAGLFVDPLKATVGDAGAAHAVLMLTQALAGAVPGEKIAIVGFGQGADCIVLETTAALTRCQDGRGPARWLPERRELSHYTQFLSMRGQLNIDFGLRAERDNRTALSAYYRKRHDITGMVGGRCATCNTLQYPASQVCVKCGARDTQSNEILSGLLGRVKSYTEDWLAYTPLPPYIYGNVEFRDGANVMMEFTDFDPGQVEVDSVVRLVFRIKDFDKRRGFRRYFWKPAPTLSSSSE